MEAILEAKERIEILQGAIRGKKRKIKILKDNLSIEELETVYKDQRKMRSIKTEISNLEKDISESLPAQIKDVKDGLKQAQQAAKEAKQLVPKQEAIPPKWREKSKELFAHLSAAKKSNNELRLMQSAYHEMEKKTGIQMDLKGVSGGFSSIDALVNTIEGEIKGEGRKFFIYPVGFRV